MIHIHEYDFYFRGNFHPRFIKNGYKASFTTPGQRSPLQKGESTKISHFAATKILGLHMVGPSLVFYSFQMDDISKEATE
jgi:hypothetical protein